MAKPKKKPQGAKAPAIGGTNIFISWSGDTSRAVAHALFEWLTRLMDDARPWMSKESIRSGVDWFASLKQHLQNLDVAIVCIAGDNLDAPWLLFEAGAFAGKVSDSARVIAYHVNVEFHEVTGPLAKYQGRQSTKEDTWEMVKDISEAIGGTVSETNLRSRFDAFWESFEAKIKAAPKPKTTPKPRKVEEMMVEVLDTLRAVQRDLGSRPTPLDYVTPEGVVVQGLIPHRSSIAAADSATFNLKKAMEDFARADEAEWRATRATKAAREAAQKMMRDAEARASIAVPPGTRKKADK